MKIRGIKPEFWTDEKVVEVSAYARLLFLGLWNMACDNGHVKDSPRRIKMTILPGDDVSVKALIDELEAIDLIHRDAGFIIIDALSKHQKIDRRFWLCCDREGCEKPTIHAQDTAGARRVHVVSTPRPRGAHGGDGDGDGDGDKRSRPTTDVIGPEFEIWYQTYPRHEAKAPALKAYKTARKTTASSILLDAITRQKPRLTADASGPKFIPLPATWLNGQRWLDEAPVVTRPFRADFPEDLIG